MRRHHSLYWRSWNDVYGAIDDDAKDPSGVNPNPHRDAFDFDEMNPRTAPLYNLFSQT